MTRFATTPEDLSEQVLWEINRANPNDWIAHSVGGGVPPEVVLFADPFITGETRIEVCIDNHPYFTQAPHQAGGNELIIGGSLEDMAITDYPGYEGEYITNKRRDIAIRHGLDLSECYLGPLIVTALVGNQDQPITRDLIAQFAELVTVTDFEAPRRY